MSRPRTALPALSRLPGLLLALLAALPALLAPPRAAAHALDPGYLELREIAAGTWAVTWKKPASRGRPLPIEAILPENCDTRQAPGERTWDGRAFLARWTTRCEGGLAGGEIRIEGLELTGTDVLVRIEAADGRSGTRRLTPSDTAFAVPGDPGVGEVIRSYLSLGVQHILGGIDHLSFVLALLLLVQGIRRLVWTVTAFTLAHSLTLAGATLGWLSLPGPPVEAVIALSIMFVASEILHGRQGRPGLTERYPWVVAFTFGLLHGFGFAGALAEIGLPQSAIPLALLFFNVGVEIGQLMFVAAVLAIIAVLRAARTRLALPWPGWLPALPPYAIGTLAAFWFIQRLAAF